MLYYADFHLIWTHRDLFNNFLCLSFIFGKETSHCALWEINSGPCSIPGDRQWTMFIPWRSTMVYFGSLQIDNAPCSIPGDCKRKGKKEKRENMKKLKNERNFTTTNYNYSTERTPHVINFEIIFDE